LDIFLRAEWSLTGGVCCRAITTRVARAIIQKRIDMKKPVENDSQNSLRDHLALVVLTFAFLVIAALAVVAMVVSSENTMTIFNTVLPVVATWVGTVLAFYFGKANFESANRQVSRMIEKLTPEQRATSPISSIMRRMEQTTSFVIPAGKKEADIQLSEISKLFTDEASRLPILDKDGRVKYMLHKSRCDEYLVAGGSGQDSLEKFLHEREGKGLEFTLNKGFILVAMDVLINDAKKKLEQVPSSQDIFISKEGSPTDKTIGWVSNIRLVKFLAA